MRKDEEGRLAPVPGYFTSQMLLMEEVCDSSEMPGFDIVEYGELPKGARSRTCKASDLV